MPNYLTKEEIRQWRSSLEKITLEEFAARLGKTVEESKPTNDVVDIVMSRGTSSNTNNNISDGFSAIAERAFKRERQISHTPFSINKKDLQKKVSTNSSLKEVNKKEELLKDVVQKTLKKAVKKEIVEKKERPVINKVEEDLKNSDTNIVLRKALTDREQLVLEYFLNNVGKPVFAKDLAELLELPRDYVYKYIKNLRAKIVGDKLKNAPTGGFVLTIEFYKKINLLEFLRDIKSAKVSVFNADVLQLVDFLNLIIEDEQFTQNIDLGLFFVSETGVGNYIVVEGMDRLLSLSLLLHAVCECYKRTSSKNENAIKVIRNKYLLNGEKTKIRLNKEDQVIYDKIIFGERLSGKEKKSPIFELLHIFWTQIKIEGYQATKIIKMLQKTSAVIVETQDVSIRELYYTLNKWDSRLNQLKLIEDYLKEQQLGKEWDKLVKIFNKNENDLKLFFKNFFITKFNVKEYKEERLFEFFVNYFNTMLNYMDSSKILFNVLTSAKQFFDLLNINFSNQKIKDVMIRIKMHRGEDTYAYLMNLLDDYKEKRISEKTFIDILNTIDEYLINRKTEDENISFNELVQYLNVLMACK